MRALFPIHRVFVAHLVSELDDLDARLTKIREVVQGLPTGNFDILKRVAEHLDKYVLNPSSLEKANVDLQSYGLRRK